MKYKIGLLEGDVENMMIFFLLKFNEVLFSNCFYDIVEIWEVIFIVMFELYCINLMMEECFDFRIFYKDMSVMFNGFFMYNSECISWWMVGLRGFGDKDFDFLNVFLLNGLIYYGG